MIDPRTPVIVGVGQSSQRPEHPSAALEPVDLLARATAAALADASARRPLTVDTVAVVDLMSWPYPDPGALLGRRLGLEPTRTVKSAVGGNSPQLLVNTFAAEIAAGRTDVVLLGGVECVHTRWRARREPRTELTWTVADDPPCAEVIGDPRPGASEYELAHGAVLPTLVYPLFETALRHDLRHSPAEHQIVASELYEHFAAVAAANPDAWSRTALTAEQIRTVTPDNRMVTYPYPKRMCANIDVDQAAALVLCSYRAAADAGVPDDRMVFPLAGADAHDHFHFTERWSFCDSPAIAAVTAVTLAAAGIGVDDVARFDLYSCFPSAVQIALRALGLRGPTGGDARPLTTTGGLAYAGGPGNDYSTHGIATMVEACRRDPGSVGLVTALGWYVTKHAAGLYSSRPPEGGYEPADRNALQAGIDAGPARAVVRGETGAATLEASSVAFTRDGEPEHALLTAITADGRRVLATSRDAATMRAVTGEVWEGRSVRFSDEAGVNRIDVV